MAEDLDKFVLQYQVDLKDSIGRLEKLHEKMEGVGKKGGQATSELKKFAADAAGELGKLVPGMNAVGTAVRAMGAEFAIAGAAIAALAIGVKSVMALRNQYNAQRSVGMQLGVSGMRIEEYQRKFVRASNGYVSRDAALEGLTTFSNMTNAAYSDPTRLGREARIMRMLGIDVGARGAAPTGFNDELRMLARGLQGKSAGDVQGIAKATGMNQDWLLSVQRLGDSIGKVTELTDDEVRKRKEAEDTLGNFNKELGKLKEDFNELEIKLGQKVIPAMDKFVQWLTKIVDIFNKATSSSDASARPYKIVNGHRVNIGPEPIDTTQSTYKQGRYKIENGHRVNLPDIIPATKQQEIADDKKKEQESRDAAMDKQDQMNKQGLATANQMSLAVNMFAGAVQSFSSAINIQQAWAAWAGELGKAAGLPGSSGATTPAAKVGPTKFDEFFEQAAKKEGVPVDLLKRIAQVESKMNPNAVSGQGAVGLMQLMPSNNASLGVKDATDPRQNIMGGAKLFKQYLNAAGGDVRTALMMYHGGYDRSGWGPKTRAYPDLVMGVGSGSMGESRAKMQLRQVQQSIADYLHVPLEQIQRGGVNRGDAAFASSQVQAGIANHIYDLERQRAIGGLPAQTYGKLAQELREQQRGLEMLKQYSGDVIGRQQAGGRDRTEGERPIIINVNGAQDPKAVAAEVNRQLTQSMNDLLHHYATGEKG
jgi:soluble lytic murein transglycosylase-like protein